MVSDNPIMVFCLLVHFPSHSGWVKFTELFCCRWSKDVVGNTAPQAPSCRILVVWFSTKPRASVQELGGMCIVEGDRNPVPAVVYLRIDDSSLIFCSFQKWEEKDGCLAFRSEGLKLMCKFLSADYGCGGCIGSCDSPLSAFLPRRINIWLFSF